MIISGLISTDKGPVDILDLKIGDMVLNEMHRPHKVVNIERIEVKGGYRFTKNPNLILSRKTKIRSLYGDVILTGRKIPITMIMPNMRSVRDVAKSVNESFVAYKVTLENTNTLYASNYCIVEESYD